MALKVLFFLILITALTWADPWRSSNIISQGSNFSSCWICHLHPLKDLSYPLFYPSHFPNITLHPKNKNKNKTKQNKNPTRPSFPSLEGILIGPNWICVDLSLPTTPLIPKIHFQITPIIQPLKTDLKNGSATR